MPSISNHKYKIEEKSTKSFQFSSKVVGLGPVDLWEFPTLHMVSLGIIKLNRKWLGTYGCVLSTVATDTLVPRHQAISIHSANQIYIAVDQFQTGIFGL